MNISELFERHFNPEKFEDSWEYDEQADIAHANKMCELEEAGDIDGIIAYLAQRTGGVA